MADVKYYPAWGVRKLYVCPRGIDVHRRKPGTCRKACKKVQSDADDLYEEEPTVKVLMIKGKVVFDTQACMEDPVEQIVESDP